MTDLSSEVRCLQCAVENRVRQWHPRAETVRVGMRTMCRLHGIQHKQRQRGGIGVAR